MRKFLVVLVITLSLFSSQFLRLAIADQTQLPHFHCSVCGSHAHGSIWHDTDKDGKPDR